MHPTFFAKASLYRKLKGYKEEFDLAEDYDFLVRAKKGNKMANIPEHLLFWRLWEKRRSRQELHKMGKIDLKIKIEYLKLNGINFSSLVAIVGQFLSVYLVPNMLKRKTIEYFKMA